MSMPMLAGVGLMVCCSSSVASLMMGGEEKEDPVVPKTPAKKSPEQKKADKAKAKLDELLAGGPVDAAGNTATAQDIADARTEAENAQAAADAVAQTGYVYDVHIVSDNAHNDDGSVISDIKIDGNRVSKDEITFHIAPTKYDCEHDTQNNWDCKGDMGYLDGDGAITMAAWNKHTPPEKFFTITSDKKIGEIEISFHRPTYAPALMIKENGVEILRDDSNKGSDGSPSPYPVKYTIP